MYKFLIHFSVTAELRRAYVCTCVYPLCSLLITDTNAYACDILVTAGIINVKITRKNSRKRLRAFLRRFSHNGDCI